MGHALPAEAKESRKYGRVQCDDRGRRDVDDPVGEAVETILTAQAIMAQHNLIDVVVRGLRGSSEGKAETFLHPPGNQIPFKGRRPNLSPYPRHRYAGRASRRYQHPDGPLKRSRVVERQPHNNEDEKPGKISHQAQDRRPLHLFERLKYEASHISDLSEEAIRYHHDDEYQGIVSLRERGAGQEQRHCNEHSSCCSHGERVAPVDSCFRAVEGYIPHEEHARPQRAIGCYKVDDGKYSGKDAIFLDSQQASEEDKVPGLQQKIRALAEKYPGGVARDPMPPQLGKAGEEAPHLEVVSSEALGHWFR